MWPCFILSRVRSALTAVAVLLSGALVVTAMVVAVDQAFPTHPHRYQSYALAVTPAAPWHPGQSLSLRWVPADQETGPDAARRPRRSRATSVSTAPTPRRPTRTQILRAPPHKQT